jgi:hypothetical protein
MLIALLAVLGVDLSVIVALMAVVLAASAGSVGPSEAARRTTDFMLPKRDQATWPV